MFTAQDSFYTLHDILTLFDYINPLRSQPLKIHQIDINHFYAAISMDRSNCFELSPFLKKKFG